MVRLMAERGLTLAVAESSSGGLVGHLIAEVPGSSAVFLGGVIAYDNALKERLGVAAEVLELDGAVSAATAEAMAQGVRRWAGADVGLALTGIAGPGGATESKPVGLTHVALAAEGFVLSERHVWRGNRSHNKAASAAAALALLVRHLRSRG
ncbi:MAG TPA: nicotinamide-nucleotide amidohydrolase family protein [Dehalococcoidia bacterium]|nr:nicotinamide-nucleotide amidohydrolase family protein [Dehalococcoidia bacterium]